ncbi:hypothetical protein [Roseomonas marmotae]|uniref:Uncharacterized protein n=1 Tax=Roseomonas marmotae TaxID=2768161 RepID=A0ABS3K901_9PROT|nr:hypothetical protein [Roseomonas marmotae]MBO1073948.1 hypothetical protein [Roseomonas marmotae]QTI78439.1 hypothetical protein IAI58_12160 [Roseomonas marmotae]
MKKFLMLGAGIVMLGMSGVALAQAPTPPANAPAAPQAEAERPDRPDRADRHDRFGPGGRGPGMMGMRGPHGQRGFGPPPSDAASFSIRHGDTSLRVRCAEDESMQACVNAASALLDKVTASSTAR